MKIFPALPEKIKDGRSLYFDNEVDCLHNRSKNIPVYNLLENPRTENESIKKILDEKRMSEVTNWIHSKAVFARLIETDSDFIADFDFSKFNLVFNRIKEILNQ